MNEEGLAADMSNVPWEELDMATLSQTDIDRFEIPVQAFFLKHTKEELFRESLKRGFVLFPLSTVKDLYENEQLKARAFWKEVSYPSSGRTIQHPGPPFLIQGMNYSLTKPPGIGEHNQEVLDREDFNSKEGPEPPKGKTRVFYPGQNWVAGAGGYKNSGFFLGHCRTKGHQIPGQSGCHRGQGRIGTANRFFT